MEQDKPIVDNTTENVATQTTEQNEGAFKVFKTKEDYDKAFDSIKASILPPKEEMDEFKAWKESKKTDAEKQQEKDLLIENLTKENNELKNMSAVANVGVDTKFQKFVLSEVLQMEGEFTDNLTSYLKDNPQFLFQKQDEKKPTTTGFSQNIANKSVSEEKAYLDKKYANNPYYKK
ncbi:MAG: hypothetical protein IJZ77_06360 [Bacilli bacterium]|nr:hypothetical protein [Bacilli bacterium]MBQ8473181.1 hypothetical protein [Bacilli bacterium]